MDDFENLTNVIIKDASSVINDKNNKQLEYRQTYSVHIPEPEEHIILKKSLLKKIKLECEKAKKNKFPWAELFLAVSSLFLGAFLGALGSRIPYQLNILSIIYYSISPTFGIGFFIAYIFYRKKENENILNLANKVEEYLLEIDDINNISKGE